MLPSTTGRVAQYTPPHVNRRISQRTEIAVMRHAESDADALAARLRELDQEWDIERTLQTNFSGGTLLGLLLGTLVHRRAYWLTGITAAFMLQHSLQGWSPPLALFRRLGVRSREEIDTERYALKALRGDFAATGDTANVARAHWALEASRR